MSYTKKTLIDGEEIKVIAVPHWINYFFPCFFTALVLLFWIGSLLNKTESEGAGSAFFVVALWTVWCLLELKLKEMVVTNKRVVCRTGVISVRTEELKNQKIESVEIKQSLLGRIFGYADIWFSGTGTSKVVFKSISDPWKLKAKFEEIVGD